MAFRTIVTKDIPEITEIIEATNGNEALEAALFHKPDVIVMDVKMPGLNGIDAIRMIMQKGIKARMVVLTAYDDFNYIQQALEMGVDDYLLKPSRRAKIVEVLSSLIRDIGHERKKETYDAQILQRMDRIRSTIENQMITLIPQSSAMSDEISNCLDFLDIKTVKGSVLVFSCEDSEMSYTRRFLADKELYDYLYEYLHARYICAVGYPMSGKIHAALFTEDEQDMDLIAEKAGNTYSEISKCDILTGAGGRFMHIKEMEASFFQSLQSLRGEFYAEESLTQAVQADSEYIMRYLSGKEEIFLQRFKAMSEKECLDAIDEIFLWIFKSMANDFWMARNYTMGLVSLCIKYASETEISKNSFAQIMGRDYYLEVSAISDLWKLKKWFESVVVGILGGMRRYNAEKATGIIEKAKAFIGNNFTNDITLEKVANHINVSTTHLSRIFKRQCGINFVDYLTKVRILKAKELLKSTDHSMKQISFETGFNDPNYFFKVFKNVVGITPGEYRNTPGTTV